LLSAKNYFCNGFKQLLSKGCSASRRNTLSYLPALCQLLLNKSFALTLAIYIEYNLLVLGDH